MTTRNSMIKIWKDQAALIQNKDNLWKQQKIDFDKFYT